MVGNIDQQFWLTFVEEWVASYHSSVLSNKIIVLIPFHDHSHKILKFIFVAVHFDVLDHLFRAIDHHNFLGLCTFPHSYARDTSPSGDLNHSRILELMGVHDNVPRHHNIRIP